MRTTKKIDKPRISAEKALKSLKVHIHSINKFLTFGYLDSCTATELLNQAHPRYQDYHAQELRDAGVISIETAKQYLIYNG